MVLDLVTTRVVAIRRLIGRLRAVPGARVELLAELGWRLDYPRWVRRTEAPVRRGEPGIAPADTSEPADATAAAGRPRFSVVMPVFDPPVRFLRKAIESVRAQGYPHWELCIADDASTSDGVRRLLAAYEVSDPRITVVRRTGRGHISAAANDAIALATGTHLAFVDHDDELSADALELVASELTRHPDAVLVYTDEDKLDRWGRRHSPHFKPDWDPDLLRGHNYVNHLTVLRADAVRAAGGLRRGYEGSQDYDLLLRVTERTGASAVRHLPFVCYHWRQHPRSVAGDPSAKPYKEEAARRALTDHLQRLGRAGDVEPAWAGSHWHRVRYRSVGRPSVTVIIPTRDGAGLDRCLGTLLSRTEFADMEVCVVDNGSRLPGTRDLLGGLRAAGHIRVIEDPRPFNYSALNNRAVAETGGDLVVLLNDDTEVLDGGWLAELVAQGQQPGVSAVGAKLLYPDGRVQHAGIVVGLGGSAGHLYLGYPGDSLGHDGQLGLVRRVTAATAACLLVRRTAYEEVGGMDESSFAVGFSDVDFCLRLRTAGHHVVWTPYAALSHHESLTRASGESGPARELRWAEERRALRVRWGADLSDPAFNPNLSLDHLYPRLSRRPRVGRFLAPGPGRPAGRPEGGAGSGAGGGGSPSPSR